MQYASESLFRELNRLKSIFAILSDRFDESAKQFRTAAVAFPETLVAEVSDFRRGVANLGESILHLGKELSVSKDQLIDPRDATLDALERSLHFIAKVEEQRTIQINALRVLDRVSCIVRRDGAIFPALLECQAQARKLRDAIIKFPEGKLHPVTLELSEAKHPVSRLLNLIENQNDLSDDEWLRFSKVVTESFGKDLALAATRGKLEVPPTPKESLDSSAEELIEESSSRAEALLLQRTPAQQPGATSEPKPLFKSDLYQEIETLVVSPTWSGSKTASQNSDAYIAAVAPALESLPLSANVALSEFESGPSIRSTRLPDEKSSVDSVLSEVEAALSEIIKLEELAELHSGQGKYSEAESVYQQLLSAQKKVFGPQNPKIATTVQKLALIQTLRAERLQWEMISNQPTETCTNEITENSQPTASLINRAFRGLETETSNNARRGRVGILAVMLCVMGVSIYAVIRYRANLEGTRVEQLMSVPSTGSVQPVAAPPGIRDMPKPVQRSQDVAQPNPVPKEVTTRQAASPEVPNIQPAQQLYEIATTRQALRPGIQETSKAVQQSQQIVQPNPIPRVPVRRETELIPPSPLLGVPAVIGTTASALSGVISTAVPPPPTPATPPLERIRVGGPPTAAKLIKEIKPMYPPLARQARIQGTVRLEGVIGPDGTVQDLKVLLGHPLLREGAIRAVKQWRYQPVLLNGVPVAVITTMDVRFSLGN